MRSFQNIHQVGNTILKNSIDPRIEAPLRIVPRARIYFFCFETLPNRWPICRSPFLLLLFYFLRAARAPLGGGGGSEVVGLRRHGGVCSPHSAVDAPQGELSERLVIHVTRQ